MDDYDEVEVLSDFNFENLFFKAESSLHSNYDSVDLFNTHSSPPGGHWFLESNINTFWSRTLSSDSEDKLSFSSFSTSPQTKFLDSLSIPNNQYNHVWSNKEKYLLEKGLELFGRSWIRLSQYIGSKTSNQIRSYVLSLEQNTEQNLVTIMNPSSSLIDFTELSGTEIINDMQIPASMEEVISAVSTAQPTVPFMSDRYSRRQKLSSQSSSDSESCDSLHSLKVETIECSSKSQSKSKKKRSRFPAKRSKLSLSSRNQKQSKARMKETNVIFIKPKEEVSQFHIKMAESNSNKNFVVLPSGEEVVKIKYESSSDESDIDIDIEDVTGCDAKPLIKIEPEECEYQCNDEKPVKTESDENQSSQPSSSLQKHLKNIREKINAIYELPPPTQERTLNTNGSVSDDEKKFHPEFFMKNDPILINRYIKIRNHIYNTWLTCRPNYVNKTAIRSGLKGDVNLISRIHAYLEQLGYINFGCEQCHYNQQKDPAMSRIDSDKSDDALSLSPTRRTTTRARNKFFSYSSLLDQPTKMDIVDEGGCTIQHINSNETVISCFGSGQIENIKNPVESTVELIPCKSYSESLNVPFQVKMSFETLALVDIHAHSSQDKEVIGLLGGRFDSDASILYISSAIACKTVNSSNIHCDMCPVSQSESSEKLYAMGQDVIGWYHSHPTFLPNPSHQDLETQQSLQTWFSDSAGLPFVGFIISPFLNPEESSASTIRCLKMEVSNDDTMSPFELNVELFFDIESNIHLALFEAIETLLASIPSEFSKDNPILCKCTESIKQHLKSIEPAVKDEIIDSIIKKIDVCLSV